MGNGKKLNGRSQRHPAPAGPEPKPAMRAAADASDAAAAGELQQFVVVLAYKSPDGEIEENVGKLVEDLKALYTFKNELTVYAVIEERADDVLALLEKQKES